MFDQLNGLEDIQQLIANGFRESETLEYKTASTPLTQSDHKEVAKDAAAFANSSGGLIIYGVATAKDDKARPERIEPIAPGNAEIISQVISSHIRQPIPRVRTKMIERDGKAVCFLVDVPASPYAPHQVVTDHRYYRRHGTRSEPMTHDLVELYFGRRLGPLIEPTFVFAELLDRVVPPPFVGTCRLEIQLRNIGARAARHLLLMISTPTKDLFQLGVYPQGGGAFVNTQKIPGADDVGFIIGMEDNVGVLHPGLERSYTFTFSIHEALVRKGYPAFALGIHADDMKAVRKKLRIRFDDVENALFDAIDDD